MVSLIQTTIGTVLGPLVGELAASRQAIERQADELKELARENGELRAENRALLASAATEGPHLTRGAVLDPLAAWMDRGGHGAGGDRRRGHRGTADGAEVVNLDVLDNLWLIWFVVAGALLALRAWHRSHG